MIPKILPVASLGVLVSGTSLAAVAGMVSLPAGNCGTAYTVYLTNGDVYERILSNCYPDNGWFYQGRVSLAAGEQLVGATEPTGLPTVWAISSLGTVYAGNEERLAPAVNVFTATGRTSNASTVVADGTDDFNGLYVVTQSGDCYHVWGDRPANVEYLGNFENGAPVGVPGSSWGAIKSKYRSR
jgi:hypothetical protein